MSKLTKTQQIVKMIRDGKSDFEIMSTFDKVDKSFLGRCHTFAKKEIDKEAEKHQENQDLVDIAVALPAPAPAVQAQMTPEMMAMVAQFMATAMQGQAPAELIPSTCSRHPKENVKAGENCPHCIKASRLDYEREKLNKFAIPCPKCNESTYHKHGGVIRKTKLGSYVCGNCELTYDAKGQSADWGKETKSV